MIANAIKSPATVPSSPWPESRKWDRHPCGAETTCHLRADPTLDCWAARVLNLSPGGVSLVLDRLVPPGKVLTVELHHAARGSSCHRQMRIIYSFQAPNGEITVGGAFSTELSDQDLQSLV